MTDRRGPHGEAQTPPRGPCLYETGEIYVTPGAVDTYAGWLDRLGLRMSRTEAQADLAELLRDAYRVTGDTETPERWRYRRSSERIDVTARVVREGRMAVIVSVSVRGYQR